MSEVKVCFKLHALNQTTQFECWEDIEHTEASILLQEKLANFEKKLKETAAKHFLIKELGEEKGKNIQLILES